MPLPPASVFIIFCASANCLSKRFTSWGLVPEPDAIRRFRLPPMILGFRRSAGVIDWMIASTFLRSRSSTSTSPRSDPDPGSIARMSERGPIDFIAWN